ncbi:MAG: hypothetical protein MUO39_11765 [Steroidobacteraceae bacterium]|nr:hypothetical protein [Steroidobacteraceae bacterium]
MLKRSLPVLMLPALCLGGVAQAQEFPILDEIAQKVIAKYQNATCEQLWEEKAQGQGKPKSAKEQRVVEVLKSDPKMQQAFFSQVATPIVTKMFQCGMIP